MAIGGDPIELIQKMLGSKPAMPTQADQLGISPMAARNMGDFQRQGSIPTGQARTPPPIEGIPGIETYGAPRPMGPDQAMPSPPVVSPTPPGAPAQFMEQPQRPPKRTGYPRPSAGAIQRRLSPGAGATAPSQFGRNFGM